MRVLLALLAVLSVALMGAAHTDSPRYTDTPFRAMDAEVVVQGTPENSATFYLDRSEYFAVEWEASAAPNFELDVVLEDNDQNLCNSGTSPACDFPGEAIVSAETDTRGWRTFVPPFTNRKLAIRVTNNAVADLTITLYIHRGIRGLQ